MGEKERSCTKGCRFLDLFLSVSSVLVALVALKTKREDLIFVCSQSTTSCSSSA